MAVSSLQFGGAKSSSNAIGTVVRIVNALVLAFSLVGCQLVAGDFEISDFHKEREGLCKAGEYRCNGEFLLTCTPDLSDWMLDDTCATPELCDSMLEQCRICNIGDLRCDGARREECNEDGSGWTLVQTCDSDAMCNPTFCGNCTAGEHACRGADETVDRELWECGPDNTWSTQLDTCETPGVCSASLDMASTDPNWSKTCVEAVCLNAGEYMCEGQELRRCRQDLTGWDTIDTCASVALCELGVRNATDSQGLVDMCPLGCASPGSFLCDGLTLQRCLDDFTGYAVVMSCEEGTDCNPVQGACTPPCSPGEVQCNGAQLRRCLPDHSWEEVARCASSVLCVTSFEGDIATSGQCLDPACPAAGDHMCQGAALYECRRDLTSWDTVDTCHSAELCSPADKRCNEPVCTTGELRCFDAAEGTTELRRCNVGLTGWDMVASCGQGQFCSNDPADPGCKLECPSATRCNGAELEQCTPNGWVHGADCPTNELCSCTINGTCTLGVGANGCGTPVCGGTQPGYQCVAASLQKCQDGRNGWDTAGAVDCGSAALCYPGAAPMFAQGYCAICPTAGEVRCGTSGSTTRTETCSADRRTWNATQTCNAAYGCIDSGAMDYCAICNTGQVQCSAATLQRCGAERRSWVSTTCASAMLCDATNNQCDVCGPPNSNTCSSNVLNHCSNDGQAIQSQTCPPNQCDAPNGQCDSCMPNTSRCSNNILYKCNPDGQGETQTTCLTTALCNATAQRCDTAVCAVGQTRCVGAQPEICNTGRTGYVSNGAACFSAPLCIAASGTCMPEACSTGQTQCNGRQPEICNATHSGFTTNGAQCDTAALCNATTHRCDMPACAVGDTSCNGAQPTECNAGRTGFVPRPNVAACASGPLCVPATGTCNPPVCVANATQCVGAQPQRCRGDRTAWNNTTTLPCETVDLCHAQSASCLTPACNVAQRRCVNGQPQICNPGRTDFQDDGMPCATAALCVNGSCQAPTCTPGQRRCNDAQPQICNADQNGWTNGGQAACASAALCGANGMCSPAACMPGQMRCNGAQPQRCNADQTDWDDVGNACVTTALCSAGSCTTPTCNPNQRRCMGAQPQVCNADQNNWDDSGMPCATTALCSGGMCTPPACVAGQTRCNQGQPEICRTDRTGWDPNGNACATAALCNQQTHTCDMPTCGVNQHRCVGASLQVCNEDRDDYQGVMSCASAALCNPGATSGSCTPPACMANEWRCNASGDVQQCSMDLTDWTTIFDCTATQICDVVGHECDDCTPPNHQCVMPNILQECTPDGHWMTLMDCGTEMTCNANGGVCTGAQP